MGGPVPVRLLPCGDAALLVEVDVAADEGGPLPAVLDLHAALQADPPPGTVDLVPAATTVLVRLGPRPTVAGSGLGGSGLEGTARHVRAVAGRARGAAAARATGAVVQVDVVYDGPDLADAAAALGTDPAGLVARHTASPWTVAFAGFAPGFGYCVQDLPDPAVPGRAARTAGVGAPGGTAAGWDVPRRASPRTAVPAGSVGLAGPFSGVYPRRAPGGWQLVGTTQAVLWDVRRDPPALLPPGSRVRFRDVGGGPRRAGAGAPPDGARAEPAGEEGRGT